MRKESDQTLRKYSTPEMRQLPLAVAGNFCASATVKDLEEGEFDFEWQ